MIRYYAREGNDIVEKAELVDSSWINIQPPFNHEELESLSERFKIPLDFLTDSLDIDERSRYEREDGVLLIVVNAPILSEKTKESEALYKTAPIGIILNDHQLITISGFEHPVLDKFLENRVKYFNPADHKQFILQIFEQTVFYYLACLQKLNLKRNLIEEELYNSSRNRELKQLLRIEKSLVYFVNSLSANELLKMKMKRTDILQIRDDEWLTDLFEDIIIDNSQALEMSNVHTNILSGTMEAYASIISNNMNVFIHRLTIITIVLMVPTLVASFYGMNLSYLPLQDNPFAFFIIILFSVILGLFLVFFTRRKMFF